MSLPSIVRIPAAVFLPAALMCICSCSRTVYVPVESSRADTLRQVVVQADTLILHDSVHIVERSQGDTVFIETVRYRYKDRIKILTDTIYRSRTDTVSIPVPVEKPLSRWQRIKLEIGGVATTLLCLTLLLPGASHLRRGK